MSTINSSSLNNNNNNLNTTLLSLLSNNDDREEEEDDYSLIQTLNSLIIIDNNKNDLSAKEAATAELALTLQMQTQLTQEEIRRSMQSICTMVPRLSSDISRMGLSIQGMKEDASALLQAHHAGPTISDDNSHINHDGNVFDDSSAVNNASHHHRHHESSSSSLALLAEIQTLSSNLRAARAVISAAASWDETVNQLHEFLQKTDDLDAAVTALSHLEESATSMINIPGEKEREEQITQFRSEVEALLKPKLVKALQTSNRVTTPLQNCVSMYRTLNKLDSLTLEYVKVRPAAVHKHWFSFTPAPPQHTFGEWLPTWFEYIHEFLDEERRHSSNIFGDDAANVTTKVLEECFRPVITSFESRMKSCIEGQKSASDDDIDIVSGYYRIIVQFLTGAYDSLSGASSNLLQTSITNVTSPFEIYQTEFVERNAKKLGDLFESMSKNANQVVESFGNETDLTASVEQLSGCVPHLFQAISDSLQRYVLLNAGYNVIKYLSSMDTVLKAFMEEISISISTLSTSFEGIILENDGASHEANIHASLELLKLSGSILQGLKDTGISYLSKFNELYNFNGSTVKVLQYDKINNFSFEEFSIMIAKNRLEGLDSMRHVDDLKTVCSNRDSFVEKYLPETVKAVLTLGERCKKLVFEVCFAAPKKWLLAIPNMSAWAAVESNDAYSASYSCLPQSYITLVGEHMLSLVQTFEPFAYEKESLRMANMMMDEVSNVSMSSWKNLLSLMGLVHGEKSSVLHKFVSGKEIFKDFVNNSTHGFEDDDDEEEDEEQQFCNQWLDSIGLAVVALLSEQILRIPKLSEKGIEQLSADLDYLQNVFAALGVDGHPHPILNYILSLVSMNANELSALIKKRSLGSEIESVLVVGEKRIAKMRGIAF